MSDEKDPLLDRHRGGDKRNELKQIGKGELPAVPVVGGPHDGQVVHQPAEVAEVGLRAPDGTLASYLAEGEGPGRRFVFVEPQ